MFRLFLIYRYRRSGGILLLYFGVFLFWMPHIILAVTSSALRIQGPIVLNGVVGCFDISPVPMFLSAMVTTFNCIVLFIFSILNRRRIRQKYLNEYRLVRWQSIVTAIFYILLVGLHVGKVAFVHKHGYAVSLVPVAMVSILFWGIVGPPFYNFIFHREAYLLAFHETFQFKFEPYSLNSSSTDNRSSSTAGGPGSPESYELATHQSTTCEEDLFHIEKADIAAANAKAAAGVAVVAGPAIFVRSISLDSFEVNREGFTPAATTGTGGVGRVSGIPASPRTSMLFQTDPTLDPRVSFNSSGSSSASSSSGSHPAAMGALHGEGRSAPSPSHAVTTGPPFAGPDAGPTPVSASSGPDSRTQVLAQDSAVPTVTLAGGHTPPPAGPSPSLAGQPFGEGPLTGSGGTLLLSGQESGEESAKESAGEFTSEEDLSEKEHAPEHPDPGEASMSSDASASDSSSPPSRASSRSSESDDALPPLGGPNDDDTSSDE
ncbi:hypothetical protein H696_03971 [Fonticula alba]|uniref:Uncharacterized protein n=1 Tax=Fonticula alba TaxID=691883 RepID=A0A058Z5M7_FONAL|nr:hypothetical protein H696_03971 [Fonticula alba]KCV69550.1 hypothetical protein H696_03971 [Fonticula alba]|eukprot:XP_009496115.1 hypothetical protein H696_03971 [Fonticula alba]